MTSPHSPLNKSVLIIPHNRLRVVMAHTTRYAFKGEARLALDAGVSKSAVSRLVNGLSSPSFAVVSAIAHALEKRLGRSLDPRELVSFDGNYPTLSACALCSCRGCSLSEAGLKPPYALGLTEHQAAAGQYEAAGEGSDQDEQSPF